MGKKGKYEGGSIPVTFRLPVKDLEKAKAGVENYLRRFEAGYDETFGSFIDGVLSVYQEKTDSILENSDPEMMQAKPEERIPGTLKKKGLGKGIEYIDPISDEELIKEREFEFIKENCTDGDPEKKIDASRLVTYRCGCYLSGKSLFMRSPSCRLDKNQHKI